MPKRLSFQLYSARNFGPWEPILAHLAKCGYREVEGFGGVYGKPEQFRALLDKHGLTMPTGHVFPAERFETDRKKVLRIARILGLNTLYCPYIAEEVRPKSGAAWKAFGKRLGETGKWLREEGFGFGWHNHDFEFVKLKDGSRPIERIFEGGPMLEWQCDLAWVAFAGENVLRWLKLHGERITAVHIKDNAPKGEKRDEHGQTDVGAGTMDWKRILGALKNTRCRHFVIEHDDPKDYKSFAKRSFDFVSRQ